jgi:D-serine dehydratase
MPEAAAALTDEPRLDWRCKGAPARAEGLTSPELGALGLAIGDMMMPVAIVREQALRHNIGAMQAFADSMGARLAPHGKTSMSPELFAMQLEAGAWAITAATAHHVRIYRRLGIGRVFLANQLVAQADIEWVLTELKSDAGFDFYCLVDSIELVERLAAATHAAELERPLQLLVETGALQGRTGARSVDEALAVARAVAAKGPHLALRGVETFEGIRRTSDEARPEAADIIAFAVAAAEAIAAEGLFAQGELLLSAGGSAFLDLCAAGLPGEIGGRAVVKLIRPGCYVTHDHGVYEAAVRPGGAAGVPSLRPALEVWGVVQSCPEPGLAIVGLGKRDVPYDAGLPRPIRVVRAGAGDLPADGLEVLNLWDQHAALACPPGGLRLGDLVGFGVSHPCGAFDRWRVLYTADERDRITGFVTTIF